MPYTTNGIIPRCTQPSSQKIEIVNDYVPWTYHDVLDEAFGQTDSRMLDINSL